MRALGELIHRYGRALRDEPRMRGYLGASLVDDVGVAVSAWASFLLQTQLFTDQRARARLMVPTLACFLVGNLVSGPLADWAETRGARALEWWRYRLVLGGRLVETVALASLVFVVAGGAPSVGRVLPYMMVSAFLKTALRPTRAAFEVDLLGTSEAQRDDAGRPLLDERGEALVYKPHLIPFGALRTALQSTAALGGLLVGGRLLGVVGGRFWPLFAFDVATNLVFVAVVALACRPTESALRAPSVPPAPARGHLVGNYLRSLRDGVRFLAAPSRRPLLALLLGSLLVELVSEAYDGKMIVKQVLHGSDDAVRRALIAWSVVSMGALVALPALARSVDRLARAFLVLMLVDGVVIAVAGRLAGAGRASAIVPFALVLGLDHALTLSATTLVDAAAQSASSAGMRGRIAAAYAFFVLVGDLGMELAATAWSEAVGLAPMLSQIGALQVVLVAVVAALGGRRLWRYGLRASPERRDAVARDAHG